MRCLLLYLTLSRLAPGHAFSPTRPAPAPPRTTGQALGIRGRATTVRAATSPELHQHHRRQALSVIGRGLVTVTGAGLLQAWPALAAKPDDRIALVTSAAEYAKLMENIETFKLSLDVIPY